MDGSMRLCEDQAWCCYHTDEGPVSLFARVADGRLDVELQGAGATWLVPRLDGLFGLTDTPERFQPVGRVRDLWRRMPGAHLPRLPLVFQRLVQLVLQQLVKWQDAAAAWKTILLTFGEPAPGPWQLTMPPTADRMSRLGDYDLVGCGILPRQARTILAVAREQARMERLAREDRAELIRFLNRLPGIGEWTIQYLLGSGLGEADAVLTGDYGLPHAIAWLLLKKARSNDEEMIRLLEPYRGHRFRVIHLIHQANLHAPRFGPRRRSNRDRFGIGKPGGGHSRPNPSSG